MFLIAMNTARTVVTPGAAAAALALVPALFSWAQSPPTGQRYQVAITDGQVVLRDTQTERDIIRPNGQPLVHQTPLPWSAELTPQPDGFDLTIVITNSISESRPLGWISLGGVRFGRVVRTFDLRWDARPYTVDHNNNNYFGPRLHWPSQQYSPVFVFGDEQTTIGVSLLYPFPEYRHEVGFQLISPGGIYNVSGRNWQLDMPLVGQLGPGQSRRYVLAVRILEGRQDEWIRVLKPYRDYFRSQYGSVRYTRDPRPVLGVFIGTTPTENNPFGYGLPDSLRPDLVGWGPVAAMWRRDARHAGFSRFMLWVPTGMFGRHWHWNFPFQFMTPMNQRPHQAASLDHLRSLASDGFQMGYWWGHCTEVMREWDDGRVEPLDPNNPEHVRLAFDELDMAVSLGATLIGLDAFGENGSVNAFAWLPRLQERAPNVKFVVEGGHADIYHLLAPGWVDAHRVQGPHRLADFLLPGHEIWAGIHLVVLRDQLGRWPTESDIRAEMSRLAALGYVAVPTTVVMLDHPYLAAESWRATVPPDLWETGGSGSGTGGGSGSSGSGGGSGTGSGTGTPAGGGGSSSTGGGSGTGSTSGSGSNGGTSQAGTGSTGSSTGTPPGRTPPSGGRRTGAGGSGGSSSSGVVTVSNGSGGSSNSGSGGGSASSSPSGSSSSSGQNSEPTTGPTSPPATGSEPSGTSGDEHLPGHLAPESASASAPSASGHAGASNMPTFVGGSGSPGPSTFTGAPLPTSASSGLGVLTIVGSGTPAPDSLQAPPLPVPKTALVANRISRPSFSPHEAAAALDRVRAALARRDSPHLPPSASANADEPR